MRVFTLCYQRLIWVLWSKDLHVDNIWNPAIVFTVDVWLGCSSKAQNVTVVNKTETENWKQKNIYGRLLYLLSRIERKQQRAILHPLSSFSELLSYTFDSLKIIGEIGYVDPGCRRCIRMLLLLFQCLNVHRSWRRSALQILRSSAWLTLLK